jgi:hypothetical protein
LAGCGVNAPLGDFGHPDGFLAIGSVGLPTGDGRKVGSVTIKGPAERVSDYPRPIRDVVDRCSGG